MQIPCQFQEAPPVATVSIMEIMKFKLTKEDAQEVIHKLSIVADEPDLRADYGIEKKHADVLLASVPVNGGEWDVSGKWALRVVLGEMQNHAEILRGIAEDARSGGKEGQALRIHKQAARFERMFKL